MELFALTYHRERTFPGREGRLRPRFVVDDEDVSYESSAEEWRVDLAARYSHSLGPLDLGVSVFDGTSREPCLACLPPRLDKKRGELLLVPHYEPIRQFGLDAQLTVESWLFKLEAIHRSGASNQVGREEDYAAFVAGGEYTFNSVFESAVDLGLLAEWNYDRRGNTATNVFDNDVFLAARVALNDVQSTEFIVSLLADAEHSTRSLIFEFNRRLSDRWSLHLEGLFMLAVDRADLTSYQTPPRRLRRGKRDLQFLACRATEKNHAPAISDVVRPFYAPGPPRRRRASGSGTTGNGRDRPRRC